MSDESEELERWRLFARRLALFSEGLIDEMPVAMARAYADFVLPVGHAQAQFEMKQPTAFSLPRLTLQEVRARAEAEASAQPFSKTEH